MSSFDAPHRIYLFDLTTGRQKLAYGRSPEDALEVLRARLTEAEMALVIPDRYVRISQRKLQDHIGNLG